MNNQPADDKTRIVIAITESTRLPALWKAAARQFGTLPVEVITLFLEDDSWVRAASLPFTREISRLSGSSADFTLTRAKQISRAAAERARGLLQGFAAEANVSLVFEILSEADPQRIGRYASEHKHLLLLPSGLAERPEYVSLTQLACRVEIVDEKNAADRK